MNRVHRLLSRLRTSPPLAQAAQKAASIEFWQALCEDYSVPFTWPMLAQTTGRALVKKLMEDKEPEMAGFAAIEGMSRDVLLGQLQGLVAKHFLSVTSRKSGKPSKKRGRPDRLNERLRLYFLFEREVDRAGGSLPWGEQKQVANRILKENPDLAPKQQTHSNSTCVETMLKQIRRDRQYAEERDEQKKRAFPEQWQEFLSTLDDGTKVRVVRLQETWGRALEAEGGDKKAIAELFDQWAFLVVFVLPDPDQDLIASRLIQLLTPGDVLRRGVGRHLQEQAVADTRRYYKPAEGAK